MGPLSKRGDWYTHKISNRTQRQFSFLPLQRKTFCGGTTRSPPQWLSLLSLSPLRALRTCVYTLSIRTTVRTLTVIDTTVSNFTSPASASSHSYHLTVYITISTIHSIITKIYTACPSSSSLLYCQLKAIKVKAHTTSVWASL